AQEHDHGLTERLGTVHFSTSCSAGAQTEFDHAVALLHSFQFSKAVAGFNSALKIDSTCGISYWGIALSQWSNPFAAGMKDKSQLQAGARSVALAKTTGAKTQRERDYITAVAALYDNFAGTPQSSRLIAYREAMSKVASNYPAD